MRIQGTASHLPDIIRILPLLQVCVPKNVLMVGNDVRDDMSAADVGMKVFLLTDCLINKKNAVFRYIRTAGLMSRSDI